MISPFFQFDAFVLSWGCCELINWIIAAGQFNCLQLKCRNVISRRFKAPLILRSFKRKNILLVFCLKSFSTQAFRVSVFSRAVENPRHAVESLEFPRRISLEHTQSRKEENPFYVSELLQMDFPLPNGERRISRKFPPLLRLNLISYSKQKNRSMNAYLNESVR